MTFTAHTSREQFRVWLEDFGKVFAITIAVHANGTTQESFSCGTVVKQGLSTQTHICQYGSVLDRDHNAASIILSRRLSTTGQVGTFALDATNAWGDDTSTLAGANLLEQVTS